jgi:Na+/melibiose symporter-like transporter
MISSLSALADIADEHELNTHRRQEGIFFAARSFFAKASQGVGHLIAGMALDFINFPVGAAPGTVAEESIFSLGMIDGPVAALPITLSLVFFWRYRLTRSRQQEIQATLKSRYLANKLPS